jgi:hypothetical protein
MEMAREMGTKLSPMPDIARDRLDGPMRTICDTIEYIFDKLGKLVKTSTGYTDSDVDDVKALHSYIKDNLPTWDKFVRSPSHPKTAFRLLGLDVESVSGNTRATQIREKLVYHFRNSPTRAVSDLRDGEYIFHEDELLCIDHIARWANFGEAHPFRIAVMRRQRALSSV